MARPDVVCIDMATPVIPTITIPNETKRVGGDVIPREFSLTTWNRTRAAAATSARVDMDVHNRRKCTSALCLFHTIEEAGSSRWAPRWVLFSTRTMSVCILLMAAIFHTVTITQHEYLRHNAYMEAVALYISASSFAMLALCTLLRPLKNKQQQQNISHITISLSASTSASSASSTSTTSAPINSNSHAHTKLSTIAIYLHAFSTTLIPQLLAMLVFHLIRPGAYRGIYLISYPLPLVVFLLDVLIMRANFRLPYRYVILPLYISAPYATVVFLIVFKAWACVAALAGVVIASLILFALTG